MRREDTQDAHFAPEKNKNAGWVLIEHQPASDAESYSERRKFTMSCCCDDCRALKALMTCVASEQTCPVAQLPACNSMAATMSLVLPLCRKKIRWPTPQSGAVRNSSPCAAPWLMPSARPGPM